MRILLTALLLLIICPLTGVSCADDKSDCLNQCANDKRNNDMYCPPAGGFTDEDNKLCIAKNSADYKSCMNTCSPAVQPPADQQPTPTQSPSKKTDDSVPTPEDQQPAPTELPSKTPDDPVTTDKQS